MCLARNAIIKDLNKQIKAHFFESKRKLILNKVTSDQNNIWKAVKIAKGCSGNKIPRNLTVRGSSIDPENLAEAFAVFFHEKVEHYKNEAVLNSLVYNGGNKLIVGDRFFMDVNSISKCLTTLKPKTSEGYDRIPVKIVFDARDLLLPTLTKLFKLIYQQRVIPYQWKIARILPIHKKGSKTQIENYRPIANLCSFSKIFEKLILNQINYLKSTNKLDLTGKPQHGFKKKKYSNRGHITSIDHCSSG